MGLRDRLKFYLSIDNAKTDGKATSEEVIGGVDFSAYFNDHYGWFVREELEKDRFEDIELRSTSAAGLKYKFIADPDMSLVG